MRLGLGAKYLSHSQANCVSSQVDCKLRAKLIPMARFSAGKFQGGRREQSFSQG
ncbi:hypothetical protein KC19_2G247000 [Ceratodon purpureus]|uniref:Uncharacterized protein n=1 Tax=Ceratodon purpureus TaxID=3225 RepID=A0A8T0IYS2_CERPU|nr:hypothetical protein KC19_2G247000 [Ceratodon purpureus]